MKDVEGNLFSENNFNETITSGIGNFKVLKTESFEFKNENNIYIRILKRSKVIDSYKSAVSINTVNKNSSVLSLSLTHPIKEKAEDVLNELVEQYNFDAIKDKSEVSQKTKAFIDERLSLLGKI